MRQGAALGTSQGSELELASRAAHGDGAAMEAIMRRHNRTLYRAARSILKSDSEAEDAVQEAYVRAYQALPVLPRRSESGHVAHPHRGQRSAGQVAAPAARRQSRGHRRRIRSGLRGGVTDGPEGGLMRGELRTLLERHIDQLPAAFRTVFVLRALETMSVVGSPPASSTPATVRTRYFRARALLREGLRREIDLACTDAFGFEGARCDRIVVAVLFRIRGFGPPHAIRLIAGASPPLSQRSYSSRHARDGTLHAFTKGAAMSFFDFVDASHLNANRRAFVARSGWTLTAGAIALLAGRDALAAQKKSGPEALAADVRNPQLGTGRRARRRRGLPGRGAERPAAKARAGSRRAVPGAPQGACRPAGCHREEAGRHPCRIRPKRAYDFPVAQLQTQADVLRFAASLEQGAVSAYLGAVPSWTIASWRVRPPASSAMKPCIGPCCAAPWGRIRCLRPSSDRKAS